ncbi:hypothetical protein PSN45_003053 [Yamadazyma tenuis]|uniref:uncharacterized protein n=1 Tax=Candida tenuis TaxID=2315449 RepID=UPI0027981FCE|nr:hypothetical protein PSN45_003053 [Yamadazyma tenuis]
MLRGDKIMSKHKSSTSKGPKTGFLKPSAEQLKKDGNLRTDVEIPEIETQPESWEDVKSSIRATIHPEVEAKKDNKFAQSLNENVVEIQQNKESNSGK